ncbi:hypothetical protein ILYODFUR_031287 [Ilyodon furcidens]|uniref:Uncharacterized protein n=1 Tax=Ilyodon furcidens TaxID=33524 RepID=A0ABV0UZH9_9TELE
MQWSPFTNDRELHPSFRAPCSLHPLHRIDCNSGLDLVLVGGAGVLKGTRKATVKAGTWRWRRSLWRPFWCWWSPASAGPED